MSVRARPEIAVMERDCALPRKSGELVFHDDWERRAFAIAVTLCEQGRYDWEQFRQHLIAEIAASASAGGDPAAPDPHAPGYYEHWLAALEKVLAESGILPAANS
ncbi:MAG: nitrile hydratase accessory protein [Gammaproteobacteria bacterium]